MGSVNKAIIVGNLGRDAELRFTTQGTPVTSFSVATTEKFNDRNGEKKEDTQWHRVNVWGNMAESLQPYLTKGKQVYCEGKLVTREWEKDGVTHKTTEIRADKVVLLGGPGGAARDRDDSERRSSRSNDRPSNVGGFDVPDDVAAPDELPDIPF